MREIHYNHTDYLNDDVIPIQSNPVKNTFKILIEKTFSNVSFFDSLGKEINKNIKNKFKIIRYK